MSIEQMCKLKWTAVVIVCGYCYTIPTETHAKYGNLLIKGNVRH